MRWWSGIARRGAKHKSIITIGGGMARPKGGKMTPETPEKTFVTSLVRATGGAASPEAVMEAMAAIKAIWEGWSVEQRAGYQAAGLDILPGYQMFICYMAAWVEGDDTFTGHHWRVVYRGGGVSPRVQGVFSIVDGGGVHWSVTISHSQYQ